MTISAQLIKKEEETTEEQKEENNNENKEKDTKELDDKAKMVLFNCFYSFFIGS